MSDHAQTADTAAHPGPPARGPSRDGPRAFDAGALLAVLDIPEMAGAPAELVEQLRAMVRGVAVMRDQDRHAIHENLDTEGLIPGLLFVGVEGRLVAHEVPSVLADGFAIRKFASQFTYTFEVTRYRPGDGPDA